jgi:hypothetical protein
MIVEKWSLGVSVSRDLSERGGYEVENQVDTVSAIADADCLEINESAVHGHVIGSWHEHG